MIRLSIWFCLVFSMMSACGPKEPMQRYIRVGLLPTCEENKDVFPCRTTQPMLPITATAKPSPPTTLVEVPVVSAPITRPS